MSIAKAFANGIIAIWVIAAIIALLGVYVYMGITGYAAIAATHPFLAQVPLPTPKAKVQVLDSWATEGQQMNVYIAIVNADYGVSGGYIDLTYPKSRLNAASCTPCLTFSTEIVDGDEVAHLGLLDGAHQMEGQDEIIFGPIVFDALKDGHPTVKVSVPLMQTDEIPEAENLVVNYDVNEVNGQAIILEAP